MSFLITKLNYIMIWLRRKNIPPFKKAEDTILKNIDQLVCYQYLRNFSKTMLCKQLMSFIVRSKILYNYQFRFGKLYSTTMALIEISDNIHCILERNYVIGIFIDFTKTFDTVDHETPLHKLYIYVIRSHANNLFRSYLRELNIYISICKWRKIWYK